MWSHAQDPVTRSIRPRSRMQLRARPSSERDDRTSTTFHPRHPSWLRWTSAAEKWSHGVLEQWLLGLRITPLLHYSITPLPQRVYPSAGRTSGSSTSDVPTCSP